MTKDAYWKMVRERALEIEDALQNVKPADYEVMIAPTHSYKTSLEILQHTDNQDSMFNLIAEGDFSFPFQKTYTEAVIINLAFFAMVDDITDELERMSKRQQRA